MDKHRSGHPKALSMRTLFIHLFGVYISIETRDLTTEINRYPDLGGTYFGRSKQAGGTYVGELVWVLIEYR
jgi:hypothetical protein